MELYTHQQKLVDRNPSRSLLAHSTGTGKTRTALELVKRNNTRALIIVPKSLVKKWERDVITWGACGNVYSKENFKKQAKTLPKYDAVIVDEAHAGGFGNFKSQMHKVLATYLKYHDVQYRYLLTATPYCSSPWNIFSLLKLLDIKVDFWNFRQQFFTERHFGQRVVFVPREGVEDDVADLVRKYGSVVHMQDCADLPPQVIREEFFEMTKEQKVAMETVKLNEQNVLSRFGKYHQIASGILIGNEFTSSLTLPSQKNEYIVSLAVDNDKVAIFCRYNIHIDLLATMLQKKNVPYLIIRGDVKDRDAVVRECENSKRMVVLINTSCSTGYELPSFPICVFASLSYSYVDMVQGMGRFLRLNHVKKNLYILCVTRDSADIPVLEAMRRKESFSEAIYTKTAEAE